MVYRQYQPAKALQPYIDAYWTVRSGPACSRILPDGCVDLICNLGSPVTSSRENAVLQPEKVYLIGTMTRYSDSIQQAEAHLAGIRFKPAAFPLFFKMPLQGLSDQCMEWERALIDVIHTSRQHFTTQLDQYFLGRMNASKQHLFPVINDILQHKGQQKIAALAKKHFITTRQLERSFLQHTGISPKAFSNITRFRSALQQIKTNNGTHSLEAIAQESGYYDHAHLSNDIRKYTGHAPLEY